ncbi:MAG TPA: SRPBCC family protein [Solirubrobacterales bacterium]
MAKDYVFLDEWDVDAPQEAVFNALADARTYPAWWKPVYIEVEGDREPGTGVATEQHFKGKLPYALKTSSRITVFDPPTHFQVEVVGDLTERASGPSRRTATAGSTSVSTGPSTRTVHCSATSPPSSARSSAGITTGRWRGRRKASNRTRARSSATPAK